MKHVNAFNFTRAESDLYFRNIIKRNGGLGVLVHDRTPTPIDEQVIVRMNRDTLYSSAVYDLAAGPVTITLQEKPDGRFQSVQATSQDHYAPLVFYEGTRTVTREQVGTRYVLLSIRTLVNPGDDADVQAAHAAQDGIEIEQATPGSFEIPEWDEESLATVREALETLAAQGGVSDKIRMGTAGEVDTLAHLMATATGWGLNPWNAAVYFTGYPTPNDASTVHQMILRDVPVDGFWSISVYNEDGYFEKNDLDAYSLNNFTAQPEPDGSIRIQFGGCYGGHPNCLPITDGWNYSLRLYRPKAEALDGRWTAPTVEVVDS